jgi:hypothetical protein
MSICCKDEISLMKNIPEEYLDNILGSYCKDEDEIKYYVNKEKRTVVCVFVPASKSFYSNIYNALNKVMCDNDPVRFFACIDDPVRDGWVPAKYVGKAKCDPKDTWNEEYGKRLAKARAIVKFQEEKLWWTSNAVRKAQEVAERLINNFDKMAEGCDRNRKLVEEMIKVGYNG